LSENKERQENEVACLFAKGLEECGFANVKYEPLPERDQDFLLRINKRRIYVQLTEIAPREYKTPLSGEVYLGGKSVYRHFEVGANGQMLGIETNKRDRLIVERIRLKVGKNYQRPSNGDEFWLCIFSSDPMLHPHVVVAGKRHTPPGAAAAVAYCRANGIGSFDRVWYLTLQLSPVQIWPEGGS
jgi:hypothetical protein